MLKHCRWLVIAVFALVLHACAGTGESNTAFSTLQPGTLQVALYPGFAPVVFHDPDSGDMTGMDVDILAGFARRHGLTLEIIERPFNGIWELPARGEVDIAGSGISRLGSRLIDGMVWSAPYYQVQRSLSIRAADRSRFQSIADFAGHSIAYTPGSTGEFDSRQRAPAGTRLLAYEVEEQAIADLLAGRIDAIARGDVSSLYDAHVNPALSVTDLHDYQPREYFVFALPADNTALREALDDYLRELQQTGAIDRILETYVGEE